MISDKITDVFGLGQSCWDYIGEINDYPPPDSKYEMTSLLEVGGGPVATALVALARWGLSCTFCGVVGDDDYGRKLTESLARENIDISRTMVRANSTSQVAFIVTEKRKARRTIFWQRPNGSPVQPDELDAEAISHSSLFYTDGLFIDASLAAARIAKRAGIPVVVDAGTLRDRALELAPLADYYIVARGFAKSLIGDDNPERACKALKKFGPEVVGVTLGEEGYIVLAGDEWIRGSAYTVDTVDTTGCGDVFHAGLAYGIGKNWEMKKTLDFAAWAAAKVSTRLGGRDGIPDVQTYGSPGLD